MWGLDVYWATLAFIYAPAPEYTAVNDNRRRHCFVVVGQDICSVTVGIQTVSVTAAGGLGQLGPALRENDYLAAVDCLHLHFDASARGGACLTVPNHQHSRIQRLIFGVCIDRCLDRHASVPSIHICNSFALPMSNQTLTSGFLNGLHLDLQSFWIRLKLQCCCQCGNSHLAHCLRMTTA